MFRLVSDWFLYVAINLQLFYGMGHEKFFDTEVDARLIICPILFLSGIIWKFRKDIHERIFKKPPVIHEYI